MCMSRSEDDKFCTFVYLAFKISIQNRFYLLPRIFTIPNFLIQFLLAVQIIRNLVEVYNRKRFTLHTYAIQRYLQLS